MPDHSQREARVAARRHKLNPEERMERVTGIGGIFFKCKDPKALAAWYRTHLGIEPDASGSVMFTDGGPTVWATFPNDTKYFAPSAAPYMLNYRVANLDKMLAQLTAAGAKVDAKRESYDYGKFGWATDPEGNRFELWEPLP
jgi:predicted enzyme related to lactoylglutathione lyase